MFATLFCTVRCSHFHIHILNLVRKLTTHFFPVFQEIILEDTTHSATPTQTPVQPHLPAIYKKVFSLTLLSPTVDIFHHIIAKDSVPLHFFFFFQLLFAIKRLCKKNNLLTLQVCSEGKNSKNYRQTIHRGTMQVLLTIHLYTGSSLFTAYPRRGRC